MPSDISQIHVGTVTYNIKDSTARSTKLDKSGGTITGDLAVNGSTSGIKINDLSQTNNTTVILNCGSSTVSMQ